MVELAQALGLRVVGEGAENPAQADELRRLGCEQAQGYLFGRPMRPAGIDQLLADGPNVVLPGTAAAV
ncbi:MAG TPA: EAL domain-containing protein [Acidimicrobiales bacterium]|nr:EAL domain-containing protein [Acidimicrobiales bacterium]